MFDDTLERGMATFRGDRSREVKPADFVEALADLLGFTLIRQAAAAGQRPSPAPPQAKQYRSNEDFWHDCLAGVLHEGHRIELRQFHLTEWVPFSPGRYHTPEAAAARERAKESVLWTRNEYLPLGKIDMMLGGVGSVRLKQRTIDGRDCYFAGLTSTGISHQGVPAILPAGEYDRVLDAIAAHAGCVVNAEGRLRVLPSDLQLVSFATEIPRYFLVVDRLEFRSPSEPHDLLATAAVMYSGSYYDGYAGHGDVLKLGGFETKFRKGWTFCSFNPAEGPAGLAKAAAWLKDYATRHSTASSDPVFSDFDEHVRHFESPIEFPIGSVADNCIDRERLEAYGRHYNFQLNDAALSQTPEVATYDVALSFAGQDRETAQRLADQLVARGVRVFYDRYEQSSLWGKDLYAHLSDIYSNRARYCVMLLSRHYAERLWTNHERRSAQERAFKERREYILPIRLDDTSIPGVLSTTGYVDLRTTELETVVDLLCQKLAPAERL